MRLVPTGPVLVPLLDVVATRYAEVRVRIIRIARFPADDARPVDAETAPRPQLPSLPTPEARAHTGARLAGRLGGLPRAALLGAVSWYLVPQGAPTGLLLGLAEHLEDPGVRPGGGHREQFSKPGGGREEAEEIGGEVGLVVERRLRFRPDLLSRGDPLGVQRRGVARGQLQGDTWPLVMQLSHLLGGGRGRRNLPPLGAALGLAAGPVGDLHYLAEHERLVLGDLRTGGESRR